MIRACVFDLDGTLLNSLEDMANSTNYALAKNGYPQWDVDQYRFFLGDGLLMLMQRVLADNYTPENSIRLVNDFNFYYGSHCTDCTVTYNGVPELLNRLLEYDTKLAVLSNKPDHFVKSIIKEMYPGINFSAIQGKIDKFPPKPNPASLLSILEELQLNADEALYVGDSNIDVYTAHNARMKVVGVTWGFREKNELEEAGADYIVDSPEDILKLVYNN